MKHLGMGLTLFAVTLMMVSCSSTGPSEPSDLHVVTNQVWISGAFDIGYHEATQKVYVSCVGYTTGWVRVFEPSLDICLALINEFDQPLGLHVDQNSNSVWVC